MKKVFFKKNSRKLKLLLSKIIKETHPQKIILFGSSVWGHPSEESDLDLLIIYNYPFLRRKKQIEIRRFFGGVGIPLDILCYSEKEINERLKKGDSFLLKIMKQGKVIYEKSF